MHTDTTQTHANTQTDTRRGTQRYKHANTSAATHAGLAPPRKNSGTKNKQPTLILTDYFSVFLSLISDVYLSTKQRENTTRQKIEGKEG